MGHWCFQSDATDITSVPLSVGRGGARERLARSSFVDFGGATCTPMAEEGSYTARKSSPAFAVRGGTHGLPGHAPVPWLWI